MPRPRRIVLVLAAAALGGVVIPCASAYVNITGVVPASPTTGQQECVSANMGAPASGPLVNSVVPVTVSGANSASGSPRTNAKGDVTFCYTGQNGGTDTVFFDGSQYPGVGTGSASVTWSVPNIADLGVTSTASPTTIAAGDNVTFALVVGNQGPHVATNVVLTAPLPAGTTFVSVGADQGSCDQTVSCNLGTLAKGGVAHVNLVVKTSATGSIALQASAKSDIPDPNGADNASSASVTSNQPVADLGVTLTAVPAKGLVGGTVALTAVVANKGPNTAADASLALVIPPGLGLASSTPSQGTCTGAAPTVTCTIGPIASAGSQQVVFQLKPLKVGSQSIGAKVTEVTAADPNPADNTASLVVAVALPPPKRGSKVNIVVVKGKVLVNGKPFVDPAQVGVGAVVDTTKGVIQLTSVNGVALFYGGVFQILESKRGGRPTELHLRHGRFGVCTATRKTAAVGAAPKVVRLLWGNGKGKFKTTGRYVAATVSGTFWLTEDRCDASLVTVRRGVIIALDLVRNKTKRVKAGQTFVVKP